MMASDTIPDKMVISLKGKSALYKNDLMMLEIIAQSNWVRPIYVALTVGSENYMNLGDNFVQEGLANRITPFTTNKPGAKNFDTEKTYNNVMNKFKFGGIDKQGIYLDETVTRMCFTHRRLLAHLALSLAQEGKSDKAKNVLAKCEKEIPAYNVAHDYQSGSLDLVRAYAFTGQNQKAQKILDQLWKKAGQYVVWYCSLDTTWFGNSMQDCMIHIYIMQQLIEVQDFISPKKAEQMEKQFEGYMRLYHSKGGTFGE